MSSSSLTGGLTLKIISELYISWRFSLIDAPAFLKSSSDIKEPSPAPFSIFTLWFAAISFFIISGVAATLVSFDKISFGIPINILITLKFYA